MSQELDDALFLVQRGATHYRSAGIDIGERMVAGDMVLVQRGTDHFKATYNGTDWPTIQDDDLVLAWDGTQNRKVQGVNFKPLFGRACPDIAGVGVKMPGQIYQYLKYTVEFTNMPAGAEYDDFYKTCYTARVIEEGSAFQFHISVIYEDTLQIYYNGGKPPFNLPATIDVEFTNNEDPSDVVTLTSNVFVIQP